MGGKDFDTEGEIRAAVVGVTELIDGHDSGSDISEEELLRHLTRSSNQLLTPRRVELWVRHGLGFPQYAEAFGENAITALDFPELIANDGAVLREDLGVKSTFHLGKITRALKRQILGLGSPPSEPLDVRAVVINHTAVAVQWRPPAESGVPPVHAYIVQTRTDDVPKWETAGRADAEDGTHVVALAPDASHRTHTAHQFRVAAWGAHGSSEYSAASAPVAVDRAGARVADGRDGSTRRARGGEDASERGGELYRAVASTFLLAGLVARFLFSSASFFGGWGTVRALAWRGAAWALRRARRARRGDERASSRRRESGPRRRGGARARFASSGRRFGERDERGGRCGGDCGGARDASRGEARRRRRRDFDPIPAQVKQELGVCGRDGRRRRRGGCPGRRARTRRVWRRVRGKRGRFRRRCGGGFRRWFGGSFRRFFPSRAIAAAGGFASATRASGGGRRARVRDRGERAEKERTVLRGGLRRALGSVDVHQRLRHEVREALLRSVPESVLRKAHESLAARVEGTVRSGE